MNQQKVSIPAAVTTVSLTPLARVVRTVLQIVISVGAAIPIILNTPAVAGNAVLVKDLGIVGAIIAFVSVLQNTLENLGIIPVLGGTPAAALSTNVTTTPRQVPSL